MKARSAQSEDLISSYLSLITMVGLLLVVIGGLIYVLA